MTEILLTSSKPDSFNNATLTATFTGPSGTKITRPGFWDGGKTWRIRFAPTAIGNWNYTTTCSDASNSGLHNKKGADTCIAYAGNLDIYKHGFVRVSPDKRFLIYADGKPFFYLADSHCFLEYEDFNTVFLPILRKRLQQRFTAYRTQPGAGNASFIGTLTGYSLGNLKGMPRVPTGGVLSITPSNYQKLDTYYQALADSGIVNALGFTTFNMCNFGPACAAKIASYMSARYGAYPDIFFTAQEVDLLDAKIKDSLTYEGQDGIDHANLWKPTFDAWAQADAYNQITTCHMHGSAGGKYQTPSEPTYYATDPHYDIFFLFGGHTYIPTIRHYAAYWNIHSANSAVPTKPFIEAEENFEQIPMDGNPQVTDTDMRNSAYKSIQCGSCGFGYGAEGIWDMCDGCNCVCCKPSAAYTAFNWSTAVNFPGADQLTIMSDFYASLPWWKLIPRFNDKNWCTWADTERSAMKSYGSTIYVVYFYGTASGSASLGTIRQMTKNLTYQVTWINPRNGQRTAMSSIKTTNGTWTVTGKPDSNDWLLLLQ